MRFAATIAAVVFCSFCSYVRAQEPVPVRPKTGKVEIFKEADLKPGMKGGAWKATAPAISGPASGPRPTSSVPAMRVSLVPLETLRLVVDHLIAETAAGLSDRDHRPNAGNDNGALTVGA